MIASVRGRNGIRQGHAKKPVCFLSVPAEEPHPHTELFLDKASHDY